MNANQWCFPEDQRIGLLIDPLDTLFFRDGRPFGAGDFARGGMPTPQTLYGMIQRYVLRSLGKLNAPIHGSRGNDGAWYRSVAVRGPWLARKSKDNHVQDLYLPVPADVMKLGKGEAGTLQRLAPLDPKIEMPGWDAPDWVEPSQPLRPLVHLGEGGKLEPHGGYLTLEEMKDYLRGNTPKLAKRHPLFFHEARTGIAIDADKQATVDGALYSARHLRLEKDIYFYAEVGLEPAHAAAFGDLKKLFEGAGVTLPFGGEGRRVNIRAVDSPVKWPEVPPDVAPEVGGFTTVLIAPAMLGPRPGTNGKGWHPPQLARLCAAAVGKPLAVSGWSLGGRSVEQDGKEAAQVGPNLPKPARYAVDAGSVYFWQAGKNAEPGRTPGRPQLTHKPCDRAAGWGVALRGVWKWAG